FVFGGQGVYFPIWSPDGKWVAYGAVDGGIAVKASDGTSEPKMLWSGKTSAWPLSWSPDGKLLVFRLQDPKSGSLDLWVLNAEGDAQPRPLISTPAEENSAAISPDGRWMAYGSTESGRRGVYVVPFPVLGEKRQVSTAGGSFPGWLSDHSIYFLQPPDNKLIAVDVETRGASFLMGAPRTLYGGKPVPRAVLDTFATVGTVSD